MYFVYAILLVLLVVIIYGAVSRKRVYNEVDRLEAWKIQIMNKPITDEIAKIKGLNMSGETENKFESWRNKWDEILTLTLPDIEERLFDIEEAANKYRFGKAKSIAKEVNSELQSIEDNLKSMTEDIHLLVNSEEDNRQQIDEVRALYKEVKKYLSQNQSVLGTTVYALTKRIEEIDLKFLDFETATVEGNYFKAREILLMIKEEIEHEKWKMEEIPKLLVQIETELPNQIEEISQGIKDMEEDGYVLEHFSFKKDLEALKSQLVKLLPIIESGNVEAANIPITDMYSEIDQMYEILEQEVLAKQFVHYEFNLLKEMVSRINKRFQTLKTEVENVKLSYRIPEEELKTHLKLDKQIKELVSKLQVVEDVMVNQKQSFITLKKTIEELKEEATDRQETLDACFHTLNSLRKDELRAKETIKELRGKIRQAQRLINKSNIPGLPISTLNKLEEAEISLVSANEKMEEVPLLMEDVINKMEEALNAVDDTYELITNTIEQALMAERVIQYGNRYRSSYSFIHEKLLEAEEYFRLYQYDEALDTALKAIEEIDPNIAQKIEVSFIEKV